ncbi:MAG: vWA domain-containing protein [Acidobacteriota bacterium]
MSLSRQSIRSMAEAQVRFARLPLLITWTLDRGPCINVATNEMSLPESLCAESPDHVRSVIGHELGHPLVFPRTSHWSTYYTMLAERLGYADAHGFVNVVGDAWVNEWNARKTPWRGTFRRWARGFYKGSPSGADPRWDFLVSMMHGLLDELDGQEPTLARTMERRAFELLFHDDRGHRQRFEELAELMRSRLGGRPVQTPGKIKAIPGNGLADLDPVKQADEFREWVDAVRGLGSGAGLEHVAKRHDRSRCLFDVAEILAFAEFMAVEDEAARAAEKPSGPEELVPWLPSDSVTDLRIGDSLRQHGVLVPGVTTLKRIDGVDRQDERSGRGTLFLVIDTSGSMTSCLGGVLVVGWAAALGARKRGDRVAALEFSGDASYLLEPGFEYRKLREILQRLEAGGGTRIGPALGQIIEVSRATGRRPTCLVLSDTDVSESGETVLSLVDEIARLGGKTLVCAPRKEDMGSWVREGQERKLLGAFVLDDLSSIHSAVKVLR